VITNPLTIGEIATSARLNALFDTSRTVYQTADQASVSPDATSVIVLSSYLILPVTANSVYAFEAAIFYDTPAAADFYLGINLPVGSTKHISWWAQAQADSATNSPIVHSEVATAGAGGVASGTIMSMRPIGSIFTAGTAGNMQAEFAQSTGSTTNTYLKAGSWVRLTKVA
jgi:hypothetical protein